MKVFIIFLIVAGIFFIPSSFVDSFGLSCAAPKITESFEESDVVFVGKVVSKEYLEPTNEHTLVAESLFSVKESFKGIFQDDVTVSSDEKFWGIHFTVGEEYLVFADYTGPELQSQLCGPTNLAEFSDVELVRNISEYSILPPLKQISAGIIPENVVCKENYEMIFKYDNSPACVKPETVQKLTDRGWKIKSEQNIPKPQEPQLPSTTESFDVIGANNQFAINFYSHVSQQNDENIFFSPWSISTAFAIAYEGSRDKTAQEIQQVFGFPTDYEDRTLEFQTAIRYLNPDDVPYQLSVANALWLAEMFDPFQEYVETATTYYGSEVSTVDFVSNDGVGKINAWVEEKTNDKIKNILAPGSTNEDTRLAITNAIYFKGNWVTQFNETDTRDESFWITPTEEVQVPLMRLKSITFNHTQTENLQILKMPYEGDRLSMLVLLPNERDGLPELEGSLSVENLNQWNEELRENKVHVLMPKFKLETKYNLIAPLSDMGMPVPFTKGSANFEGIAPISLFISQAVHKAFVDVNEEGTEAAAATVIVISTESEGPRIPVFMADHPFVFLIQDDSTGNILFIGRVIDPTK